jgi:tetratricopeptide (TPR) repeat protein
MITELGRLNPERLGVIARTTSMKLRSLGKGISDIGNELGVQYILEGSVRKVVGRVLITVRLIQAMDQVTLWNETYDRRLEHILDIQQDVAKHTARSLAMELLPEANKRSSPAGSKFAEAHELYLKGICYWNLRTEEGFRMAIQFLDKAIELDPEYALAHAGLANVYNTLGLYAPIPPDLARSRAKDHAEKALMIDPNLAEAHTAMGYALLLFDWNWKNSEEAFQTAIRNNPNYIEGHHWYSFRLALLGQFKEAESQMDLALKGDPLSFYINTHKGWIYYFSRRYHDAAEQLHYSILLKDDFALSHYFLGLVYIQMEKLEDAYQQFHEARELSGNHPAACAGLGYVKGVLGKKQEALRFLDELNQLSDQRHISPYFYAFLYLGLNNNDAAMQQLEKAYTQHCGWVAHLNVEPLVDILRQNPQFQNLLQNVGFPR